jgi:NhaA family Na+:H+ antiporter
LVPRIVVAPLQRFLATESAGGIVLLAAAVAALGWANSPWSGTYGQLWSTDATLSVGPLLVREDLRHWVNDAAMAVFFFVVGLEIKREVVHGDLRDRRVAVLPVVCAVGGMAVPAGLFLAVNVGSAGARGWGIPMATDIAFSLGVLFVVGRRAPAPLKAFLLALAIADDIGAIVVIALFYSSGIAWVWLAGAVGGLVVVAVFRRLGVRATGVYVALGVAVWMMTYESGVHATLAGVALGLLTPAWPFQSPRDVTAAARDELDQAHLVDGVVDERDETTLLELSTLTSEAVSPLARLERRLHPWTATVVLPLFALANAGIALTQLPSGEGLRVAVGVGVGLVIGKPLGIVVAAVAAVRLFGAARPPGVGWLELGAAGMLAGVGFTVSLFITGLAFDGPLADAAKVGILGASVLAGGLGALLLLARPAARPLTPR